MRAEVLDLQRPEDLREWRRKHVPVFNASKLQLGTFGQNCSNG